MKNEMNFSLLMSVYKKEKPENLNACLNSIASQTFLPTEIILVEDGLLTDDLYIIIEKWKNKLKIIKSVKLESNSGLAIALNIGLKNCTNNIVARMDSDDICVPDRFKKQIIEFENDSSLVLLGGQVAEYDEKMEKKLLSGKKPKKATKKKR